MQKDLMKGLGCDLDDPEWNYRRRADPGIFYKKARAYTKSEDGSYTAYKKWNNFFGGGNEQDVVHEDSNVVSNPGVIDERVHKYKGVLNRLNQGNINDPLHELERDFIHNENLFSREELE